MVLDLQLRFRVHALMTWLRASASCRASIDLTPGIRSLQIHYDSERSRASALLVGAAAPRSASSATSTRSRCRRASCTCRCRGTTRRRSSRSRSTRRPCGPTRRGARATSSSFVASTGSPPIEDVQPHRVRRQLPGAGPGRRLPRRARRDAGRSAAPPGHHQVQPGAHLDAGERRRHRRRVHVHLRHGGAGRLPVRGPHAAGLQPLPRDRATFAPGTPWLLRFFDQIRFYPVSAEELLDMRRPSRPAASSSRSRKRPSASRLRPLPARPARGRSRRFAHSKRAAFEAERQRWIESGQRTFSARMPDAAPPAMSRAAAGRRRVEAHVPGSVWKVVVPKASASSAATAGRSSSR